MFVSVVVDNIRGRLNQENIQSAGTQIQKDTLTVNGTSNRDRGHKHNMLLRIHSLLPALLAAVYSHTYMRVVYHIP